MLIGSYFGYVAGKFKLKPSGLFGMPLAYFGLRPKGSMPLTKAEPKNRCETGIISTILDGLLQKAARLSDLFPPGDPVNYIAWVNRRSANS